MSALDFAWRWPIVWACYFLGHWIEKLVPPEDVRLTWTSDAYQRLMGWSHQLDKYEVCWVTYEPGEL